MFGEFEMGCGRPVDGDVEFAALGVGIDLEFRPSAHGISRDNGRGDFDVAIGVHGDSRRSGVVEFAPQFDFQIAGAEMFGHDFEFRGDF